MDGKFFTNETKNLLVKVGDELIKLPFWAEPFDSPAFRWFVNFLDAKADKFIPDTIDPLVNAAIIASFNGNYDLASEKIGTAINQIIDIPLLDENTEQTMFVDGTRFILRLVNNWITKKKDASV